MGYGIATGQANFIFGAFYLFAINRIITALIVIAVIPSTLGGAYTVYLSVLERNISSYLDSEFVLADTQLVQSSADN